ncbi:ATP-grasp domain-containing protein [Candidatus Magnetomonas plexicatena]|uniref:ATP-grasp domain-containing protein n=1 Tax=Candidatus Magnetomonas plexicatena TaxID=2552947 RepID=UPI001C781500|nr:ATP-grasp domain-containing protein [Nitrospirales bacterium LBB_01]
MNVLITSASKKVWLIKAFQKALALEGGGLVYAVDISPNAPALYFADKHSLCLKDSDPAFISSLLSLCKANQISLVIPTRDEELPIFSKVKDEFQKEGISIMTASPTTIDICQDKKMFIEFCNQHGFNTPLTYDAATINETPNKIAFPVFVKPIRGKGGANIAKIKSLSELRMFIAIAGDDFIIQKYIKAPEYTIDLFSDLLGNVISVVPRVRIMVFGGESYVSKTHLDQRIIAESTRLAKELNLIGHNTIQCFLEKGRVLFIEVNPRYGGGAALSIEAGADTPRYMIKLLKGGTIDPHKLNFTDNLYMLRYTGELYMKEKDLCS